MSDAKSMRTEGGCGLWGIFAAAAGLLILLYHVLSPVETSTGPPSMYCRNNLKQIGLALHQYHDDYGSLPPAVVHGPDGTPWHSWRVLILPYLEDAIRFKDYRFDEPWDGPNNRLLAVTLGVPEVFQCPAERTTGHAMTSYLAVVGEDTMWPDGTPLTFTDVADGLSNTILAIEVTGSGIHWMEPRDLRYEDMSFVIGSEPGALGSRHPSKGSWGRAGLPHAKVLFGDGYVRTLDSSIAPELVKAMLLRNDGGPTERGFAG